MRLARAMRAGAPGTATEPDAVRAGAAEPEPGAGFGRTSVAFWPPTSKAPSRRRTLWSRPWSSRIVTKALSQATTMPLIGVPRTETSRPGLAATTGGGFLTRGPPPSRSSGSERMPRM